ncbi:alkaline phosphatase family protein [Halobacterium bonnevillei]|uniref:Nucleotide pyrophosphatase n=1 Tax=Halobacterium bonnevillei TaxID=2692200 RepID=A0A6B0SCI2_9EURY|nr:alkaline phosphatase family protein [Halobacterium bonnevillei]MXR19068.1 nucleotide pyrophosphatase [Halobacterium bonnevillei]
MSWPRTVVVGIDGGHFELIQPWVEAGHLPNIKQIIDQGTAADLESVLPPVTSPNWKAYATGRNPGQFGIFWWENVDVKAERVYYPSERKNRYPDFWEYIAEDEPVGVVGVPTTYPPKSVDSFIVAGAPDGENSGFANPQSVERFLTEEFDYRVIKENRMVDDPDATTAEILDLIDLRFRAAKRLCDEHDITFLQLTTFYINTLHHFCWDDEETRRAWELIDDHLGEFLAEDRNVILMSDHGSNKIRTAFHINTWLEQRGFLHLDSGIANSLHRVGLTTDTLIRITSALGIRSLATKLAPQFLLNQIPDGYGEIKRESKTDNIDWGRTEAIASGQGPIYLTIDEDSPQYDEVRESIREGILELTDPDGNPVADAVYRGEEVYHGEYSDEAPDLVIDQARAVHIPGGIGRDKVFTDPATDGWRAENKRHGLFAAIGPDFATGVLDSLSILDLAPTLLHLHNCHVPESFDGAVRTDLFADGSAAGDREPMFREKEVIGTDGDEAVDDNLQSRLSDLGYLE